MKKLLLLLALAGCDYRMDSDKYLARGHCDQIKACRGPHCQNSDYMTKTDCDMVGGRFRPRQ